MTIHQLVPGSGEGQHTGVAVNWRSIGASQGPLEGINLHHLAADIAGLADWWEGGTAPLLVIQGLDDRRAPPSNGRALRDQVGKRVRLVELPQAGHFLVLEQPQVVTEAVITFLREQEPERTRGGLPPIVNATS